MPLRQESFGKEMTDDERFWVHEMYCIICNQHPQSVASFHYEAMCAEGRALAVTLGMFNSYGPPVIAGPNIYVQDTAGYSEEEQENIKKLNKEEQE